MARTPLLSRFQQLVADFKEADRSGLSVEAVQAARHKLSRRDFLKVTGATVGAAALTGSLPVFARAAAARSHDRRRRHRGSQLRADPA